MSKMFMLNAERVFHAKAAKKRRQEFGGGLDGASCKPMLETNMGHPRGDAEEVSNIAIVLTVFATSL